MATSTHRRRFTRAAALTGAVTIIASAGIGWHALIASAAFPGTDYETEFEIDANTEVNGGQDWDSTPASAPKMFPYAAGETRAAAEREGKRF